MTTAACTRIYLKLAKSDQNDVVRADAISLIEKCLILDMFASLFLQNQGLESIFALCKHASPLVRAKACRCLGTLGMFVSVSFLHTAEKASNRTMLIKMELVVLVNLLQDADLNVRAEASRLLMFLAMDAKRQCFDAGIVPLLVANLGISGTNDYFTLNSLQCISAMTDYLPAKDELLNDKTIKLLEYFEVLGGKEYIQSVAKRTINAVKYVI